MDTRNPFNVAGRSQAVSYDMGLRSYMLGIYNYMASALALTGIVALIASQSPALMDAFYQISPDGRIMGMKPLGWVVAFAPLVAVLGLGMGIQRLSIQAAQMCFWGFAVIMGLSMASIFLMYTGASIARVFFITAAMFGGMSLYGYTTKRDLTGMGSFLIMGVWGILIASIVNIWLQSPAVYWAVSFIGVFLFLGLTAYDTQKLKSLYYQVAGSGDALARATIIGALELYLDFINLFIMLLRFFGERR